jgi:OOP family OmpA-OmpF porin
MRQLMLPMLLISLATACSQNPHLEVKDPAKVASSAVETPKTLIVNDRDQDGTNDDKDLCPDVPGPASNKGCPYSPLEDSDQDGVINEADQCPTVPGPAANNGCPYDNVEDYDHDGVPNTDDRCPMVPGPAEHQGCPYPSENDIDRDGVIDRDDRCPRVPGQIFNDGCPISDTDGDGVWDHLDRCPRVPGPATNRGCPLDRDTDGDFVPDNRDRCPLVPGQIFNDGCPIGDRDIDRDGVPDRHDACPRVPGPASNRGCPYPKEEERRVLLEAMASLKFDFDRAEIKQSSFPSLEKLAAFLRKYPDAKLKMVGHTDDVGTDEYNIQLSRARVQAVKDYLVEKGVFPNRTVVDARGESEPLVSVDGLPEGSEELDRARAQNRRVDMSVIYEVVSRR